MPNMKPSKEACVFVNRLLVNALSEIGKYSSLFGMTDDAKKKVGWCKEVVDHLKSLHS